MTELGAFLLPLVPLLALVAFLLLGRYPGADAIVRLSQRFAGRARRALRRLTRRQRLPLPPRSFAPGGGLLIALGLAQRPPPALS